MESTSAHPTHMSHLSPSAIATPSAPGLVDRIRNGVSGSSGEATGSGLTTGVESSHPLEQRLHRWEAQERKLRMDMLARVYGIGEVLRREQELRLVRSTTWRPEALGGGTRSLHEDILTGRDTTIDWSDVYKVDEKQLKRDAHHENTSSLIHIEMERKLRI